MMSQVKSGIRHQEGLATVKSDLWLDLRQYRSMDDKTGHFAGAPLPTLLFFWFLAVVESPRRRFGEGITRELKPVIEPEEES
jgi:hypothetical protein